LEAGRRAGAPTPEGFRRVGYLDTWDFVTACLTEAGADEYIRVNGHDLKEPRTYVTSGYRNQEWIDLRAFFMDDPSQGGRRPMARKISQERAESIVLAWLQSAYGFAQQQLDAGELSLLPDGEGDGHFVFDLWEGEANRSELLGMGYVHPDGHVEGLY
jgi:hypothetical protein